MRKIVDLLEKGELTPRERCLMIMQNNFIKATTGEKPLTEADISALENWRTKDIKEVDEWNKYIESDRLISYAGLETEIIYLQAKAEYFRRFFLDIQLNFYPFIQKIENLFEKLETSKTMNMEDYTSLSALQAIFKSMQFFKKIKENDEIILDFSNETSRMIFKESRENLIDSYAKLLAFQKVFKRLSIIYEIDLVRFINEHLENISHFIKENNNALSKAMGQKLSDKEHTKEEFQEDETTLKMKENLFIDIDSILPDTETLESWNKKFTKILGNEY